MVRDLHHGPIAMRGAILRLRKRVGDNATPLVSFPDFGAVDEGMRTDMAKRGPKGMSPELKSFIHSLHDKEFSVGELMACPCPRHGASQNRRVTYGA
jgi:hypothetical protein